MTDRAQSQRGASTGQQGARIGIARQVIVRHARTAETAPDVRPRRIGENSPKRLQVFVLVSGWFREVWRIGGKSGLITRGFWVRVPRGTQQRLPMSEHV
jgi:hypothetical protein